MARPSPGTIVVLNGPSSAGKTTLANALRDARAPHAAAVSIDQLFATIAPTRANDWPLFATLTDATFATAAALANGGLDVFVDTVLERAVCLDIASARLDEHRFQLVAMTCALKTLESRERARGDRRLGQARDQRDRVLHDASYALTLDTGLLSVADCVERVLRLLPPARPA